MASEVGSSRTDIAYDPENIEIGVVLGLPTRGRVRAEWAIMYRSLQGPVNGSMTTKTVLNAPVAQARQAIAEWAIDNKVQYLFFLDDDVLVPNNGLRRLIYQLDNNPDWDLITGVYVTKTDTEKVPPEYPEPLVFGGKQGRPGAFWDWKLDERFPIWGCGMGCALIRVSAIAKLEPPYFSWEESVDGLDSHGEGEDMYFCRKLTENGSTLMCDGGLLCGHIDNKGDIHSIPEESYPIQQADAETLKNFKLYGHIREQREKQSKRKLSGVAGSG